MRDANEREITVSALHIYPVKSGKGLTLSKMEIGPKGPVDDRRWMFVDDTGRFLSQRQHPKMCFIEAEIQSDKLIIRSKRLPPLIIKRGKNEKQKMRHVTIWKDSLEVYDMGNNATEWASDFFGFPAHLVFIPDDIHRKVNPKYALKDTDEVSFTDGYPLLIISEASLGDLNLRLENPVPMNRFRPSIVVSGCEAFEEDRWKRIRIGSAVFSCVKGCSRCVLTTVDQAAGSADEKGEPLVTLSRYRKTDEGIMFGQNAIPEGVGSVSLNDEVIVLQ